jgi:peptidoglycan/xylan/chitin deacetylase (PgdA/CDA1 family)
MSAAEPIGPYDNNVTVVVYHDFNRTGHVTLENFTQQMDWLKHNGYKSMLMKDVVGKVMNNMPIENKTVVLTFDDGWESGHSQVAPILEAREYRGTFYIIARQVIDDHSTSWVDDGCCGYMNHSAMIDLHSRGHEIGVHSWDHNMTEEAVNLNLQINESKKTIDSLLNWTTQTWSYPNCVKNEKIVDYLKENGFIGATSCHFSETRVGAFNDVFDIYKFHIKPETTMDEFKILFPAGNRGDVGSGGIPLETKITAKLDGKSYDVTGKSMTSKPTEAAIQSGQSVTVKFDKAGEVELTIPKAMISGINSVMAGNRELLKDEPITTADLSTIKFTVPADSTTVLIKGAAVVPEFPIIAATLAVTIAGFIVYTRFTRN